MSDSRLNIQKVRADFPILSRQTHGKPLVFLDSAASSQKPKVVIDAMTAFYSNDYANVHRGVYELSQKSTENYEGVRSILKRFFNTKKEFEFIYTSGTTGAINLVANAWAKRNLKEGDEILITRMEHHANFVPWQAVAKEVGAHLKIAELTADFRLDLADFKSKLNSRTKLVAFTHMSNVLGTINPVEEISRLAKEKGARVLVDIAQSSAHLPIDLSQWPDIDFAAFSAHKLCGPTGAGALWAREAVLKEMDPYQWGGDMIAQVRDDYSVWNEAPWKFEAGTPNIVGVYGMGVALEYIERVGRSVVEAYEKEITAKVLEKLVQIDGLKLIGPSQPDNRGSVFSFVMDGVHPHDMAQFLDSRGVCVRAGHHCAQPLIHKLGISATTRASFSFYNTFEEADILVRSIQEAKNYFGKSK